MLTARDGSIVHRYRRLGAVLLDPDVGDDELRARLLSTVPEAQLREDQSDLANWTRGDRKARFEADGRAARRAEPVRRAVSEQDEVRRRGVPPDAPLDFAPAALQPLIRHDGVTDRRRWGERVVPQGARRDPDRQPRHRRREELRPVRGVLPARRAVGADPRCVLGANRVPRRSDAAVERLKVRLSDAFDRFLEGVADNRQVAFDDDGWRLKTDAAEQPDLAQSDSLAELHRWLDARSRTIRLADLLIEVENPPAFRLKNARCGVESPFLFPARSLRRGTIFGTIGYYM